MQSESCRDFLWTYSISEIKRVFICNYRGTILSIQAHGWYKAYIFFLFGVQYLLIHILITNVSIFRYLFLGTTYYVPKLGSSSVALRLLSWIRASSLPDSQNKQHFSCDSVLISLKLKTTKELILTAAISAIPLWHMTKDMTAVPYIDRNQDILDVSLSK